MYQSLLKLFLIAAAIRLGFSLTDLQNCTSGQCVKSVDQATRKILKIDWKPISVFPNEAKRFR